MKLLLDILMYIMAIIAALQYVTDHMQGFVKPAISSLVQSHQNYKKNNHPNKYTPKNYYSKEQSVKHVP